MPGVDFVHNPILGDSDRAEDLLNEIQAVLQKRGALMIHKPDCIVLAVAEPNIGKWRAIAQVKIIAAAVGLARGVVEWRPIDWADGATKQ